MMECNQNVDVYCWEQKRLDTFLRYQWPNDAPIKPEELAAAGFYYTGQMDKVRCAFCGHVLGQWAAGDTAIGEHRRFYAECPFLKNPLAAGNVPIHRHFSHQPMSIPPNAANNSNSISVTPSQESQRSSINEDSLRDRPINFNYGSFEARLKSFVNYPQGKAQTPQQLAEAGFYYTGTGDSVKCFFCDGGLKDWDPVDNPWTEHAHWFPDCGFLKLARGEDFITNVKEMFRRQAESQSSQRQTSDQISQIQIARQMGFGDSLIQRTVTKHMSERGQAFTNAQQLITAIQAMEIDEEDEAATPNTSTRNTPSTSTLPSQHAAPAAASKPPDSENSSNSNAAAASNLPNSNNGGKVDAKNLEKTIKDLEDERTCKICMDTRANVVFLDCGHLICCESCATQVKKCPMCRQIIKKVVKTFMN